MSRFCACGCGQQPAGRKARFLPGHDAKLKSRILIAHKAKRSLDFQQQQVVPDAVAAQLGWSEWFNQASAAPALREGRSASAVDLEAQRERARLAAERKVEQFMLMKRAYAAAKAAGLNTVIDKENAKEVLERCSR